MVSQSDVIKLLWNNRAVFGPVLSSTVEALEMDDGACLTVRPARRRAAPAGAYTGTCTTIYPYYA